MTRVLSMALLIVTAFAAPLPAGAQSASKGPRIGFLCTSPCGGPRQRAFVQRLEELGYVDGRTITIVYPRSLLSKLTLRADEPPGVW
jgi:hypothetical protein